MRLDANQQTTAAVLIAAVVLASVGGGYYHHRQKQTDERLRKARARRAAAAAQIRDLQSQTAEGDDRLARFLPPRDEPQAFTAVVRLVESSAKQCQVDLSEIKPLRPLTQEDATKQLCSATVEGDSANVVSFLRRLEDNQSDPELYRLGLWVEALALSMPSDQEQKLLARMEIARLMTRDLTMPEAAEETTSASNRLRNALAANPRS